MKDAIREPVKTDSKPPAQTRTPARSHSGPMGYGNGPVITACVMTGGAALIAGCGLARLVTADCDFSRALQGKRTTIQAPADPGDKNAGGGSAQAPSEDKKDTSRVGQVPMPGRDDEDKSRGSARPPRVEPQPKARSYTIRPGDTLAKASGATGVPIGILVEVNKIQDPNLIHAGASLLIPPVR
ncbi:LysM peptidoglycan-binding domain-containing protein [Streptomyces sp. NPDC088124]|uniref:LysM peptidoglycan-binding domain-containing protein n=1 Tax=Streptomyces sp. NPDC088124 TaxID=3154654 RepID=UPI003448158B